MQHKSKILLRLNILYGIFLILLFLSLGNTFFSGDFRSRPARRLPAKHGNLPAGQCQNGHLS